MGEISAQGFALDLRPALTRLGVRADAQAELDSRLLEQAKRAVSARLGTTPEVAFELVCGLARSQGREVSEYAAAVVATGGSLSG
jgi:hypothetical protein